MTRRCSWLIAAVLALTLPSCGGKLPPEIPLPDSDGDGLPDLIDPCPTNPDPTCVPEPEPPTSYDCENPPALAGLVKVRGAIKNQYIVVLKPSRALAAQDVLTFAAQFKGVNQVKPLVRAFAARVESKALGKLLADPGVAYVQQEGTKHKVSLSWGLDRIDAREGLDGKFEPGATGAGVRVYANDTGVTRTNDLGARLSDDCFSTIVLHGCEDGHGHGTHVAGTAAGTTWGVAKGATVHSVRFLDERGSGTDSDAIRSLDWIAQHAPGERGVVNASWGGSPAPAVDAAVCRVIAAGKVFVAAAGNDSADARGSTPARVIQVLTVGAMDRSDKGAYFSNTGPGVDLFAPGVDIESDRPDGGTTTMSGTSMATPHVVGGAALYLERHPGATVAEVHVGIVAAATKDTLSDIGEGSPNLLLFVGTEGTTPSAGPKVVDGRWEPFLRGAINCCDYDGTPDVNEGLEDGWTLITPAALDRIKGPGTVNLTHLRTGPFSVSVDPEVLARLSSRDAARVRATLGVVSKYGPGPEILPHLRVSLQAVKERGMAAEVDVVDCWALATPGMNYYGDNCWVTQAAPPEHYVNWARAVVEASWDMPVIYNLGNECFRCKPSEEWERGLYDAIKAALAEHGVDRPVGNTVKLSDLRVSLDYRTYHGFEPVPADWPRDIPTMLTESDNEPHSPAEWAALAKTTEARGGYLAVWRGPDSWDSHNGAINALPPLGEPGPEPEKACPKELAPGSIVYLNDQPYGHGFDSTVRVKGDPEFCRLIHGEPVNDCHLEGWPTRVECEMQLLHGCPIWQFTPDNGTNVYPCIDDQTELSSCDHFGSVEFRDDPQTPTTGDTLETLRGFEGQPLACGLQRDAHGPVAGFFCIAHGVGKVRACKPDGQGCGPFRSFNH